MMFFFSCCSGYRSLSISTLADSGWYCCWTEFPKIVYMKRGWIQYGKRSILRIHFFSRAFLHHPRITFVTIFTLNMLVHSLSILRCILAPFYTKYIYTVRKKKQETKNHAASNVCTLVQCTYTNHELQNDNDDERNEAAKWTNDANERANNEAKTLQR